MKRAIMALSALLMAMSLVGPAHAETSGYALSNVNVRSGPGTEYPPLGLVPAGAPVFIHGCLGGWTWCDTSWGPLRGWVHGAYLAAVHDGRRIGIAYAAPYVGVPVISFNIGTYWDRHYRGRSFYRDRHRWERRHHDRRERRDRRHRRRH